MPGEKMTRKKEGQGRTMRLGCVIRERAVGIKQSARQTERPSPKRKKGELETIYGKNAGVGVRSVRPAVRVFAKKKKRDAPDEGDKGGEETSLVRGGKRERKTTNEFFSFSPART